MPIVNKIPMIFVFGSNESGIHGAGAAAYAHHKLRAKWGVGEGLTGDCYALPTKDKHVQDMTLDQIRISVGRFLQLARKMPDTNFQVTQVGCGLAGWRPSEIAPLFYDAPSNCWFDKKWKNFLPQGTSFWGTV